MQATVTTIIEDIFPESFRKIEMFRPFLKQLAATKALRLQEDLNNAKNVDGDLEEDDKKGVIADFLHDLHEEMQQFVEKLGDEDQFIDIYSQDIEESDIPKETITIPSYRRRKKDKGKGKDKQVNKTARAGGDEKAINPKTGSKVSMTGRVFKTLVKNGLLTEEGEFTEEGQRVYDTLQAKKPRKIPHPERKGGKINLGGDAYKKLLEKGWVFNEETEKWTFKSAEDDEETEEMSEEESPVEAQEDEKTEEETEEMTEEESPEEAQEDKKTEEESETEVEKEEEGPSESKPEKVMIPHPKEGRPLVLNGRGHKSWLKKGWTYNEETKTWSEPEEEETDE